MSSGGAGRIRAIVIWAAVAAAVAVPVAAAASSPLLAWRDPVYIAAGFAGVFALVLLFLQPLLIRGVLPGLSAARARRLHRWTGGGLALAVVLHVAGLWFTSPPDVIDALLFASPTPFSAWGVTAMWAVFATAVLAAFRRRLKLGLRSWRVAHLSLAAAIVAGTVVHALLIEGAMEPVSKAILCALTVTALLSVITVLRRTARPRVPR